MPYWNTHAVDATRCEVNDGIRAQSMLLQYTFWSPESNEDLVRHLKKSTLYAEHFVSLTCLLRLLLLPVNRFLLVGKKGPNKNVSRVRALEGTGVVINWQWSIVNVAVSCSKTFADSPKSSHASLTRLNCWIAARSTVVKATTLTQERLTVDLVENIESQFPLIFNRLEAWSLLRRIWIRSVYRQKID